MNRARALQMIASALEETDRVIVANGAMGREFFAETDNPRHLVLLGSMGLAASVGVGYALQHREHRVLVLDGDGNLMMGLGGLLLAGTAAPANLLHLVLDNRQYATTGGQPTGSERVDLAAMARAAGYAAAVSLDSPGRLLEELKQWTPGSGPGFIRVMIAPGPAAQVPRIPYSAPEMAVRFRTAEP